MDFKEILTHLEYSACDCEVDYKPELHVVNGKCPNHPKSFLLVDGVPVEFYERVAKKFDKPTKRKL